ncbi:MAG: molybdopterin converting factor subunit 1 [Parasphingorhabdus sp.]|uniref:molybdopterin converting factor subunit 1 n=1 Tax=Parasphingorhabdus sp. TaxID=2709688 RepID=UPI003262D11C
MDRSINIIYFAWVRERLGIDQEAIRLDDGVKTIEDLLALLTQRGAVYAEILADAEKLRFALDQDYAVLETPIGSAHEIAIFPPVTGG